MRWEIFRQERNEMNEKKRQYMKQMTRQCVLLAIYQTHAIVKSFKKNFDLRKTEENKRIRKIGYAKLLRWRYKAFTR